MNQSSKRQLAALLFADIVGYTALMQQDETNARQMLEKFHQKIKASVKKHQGRVINNYGDGCLCTFESAVSAVQCAKEVQLIFQKAPIVPVRMGLHSGDVFFEGNNVYGDSVNIASRIESLGVAGAVLFSKRIKRHISNQKEFDVQSLGEFEFKNVEKSMEVFALADEGLAIPDHKDLKGNIKGKNALPGRILLPAIVSFLVLVSIGYYFFFYEGSGTIEEINADAGNTIAVFPFDVSGSPDLQYLGEGMVDLISTRLDEIPALKSVDPNLVFSKLDNETSISRNPQKAASLAGLFGANQFILGRIIEIGNQIEISATRYHLSGERMGNNAVKENKAGQLALSVDKLIKNLIAEEKEAEGDELNSLAALTSSNLESLKAYLKGEQAFRKGRYQESYDLFLQATQLDSTFALAWMRVGNAATWNLEVSGGFARRKWAKYRHTMPKKWQEYYEAVMLSSSADQKAIPAFENLIRKYGETHAFLNGLAEFYFHFNPVYGRSQTEAKPYLEKSLELDKNNQEVLIHLGHIAVLEKDTEGLQNLISRLDKNSEVYPYLMIASWVIKDTITDKEIRDVINHPQFLKEHFTSLFLEPDGEPFNLTLIDRVLSFFPDEEFQSISDAFKAGYAGKEKECYEIKQKMGKVNSSFGFPYDQYFRCTPASLMAVSEFLPYSEYYESLYEVTKNKKTPWDTYAAIKYAIALNKEKEGDQLKEKLLGLADSPRRTKMVKHYDYSIKAFEAKSTGDNELALSYIDSAYQYPFGYWEIQTSNVDKSILAANIYAEQGLYKKSIPYYENMVATPGNIFLKGYRLYKLGQWYEKIGNTEKALKNYDLLISHYNDCDEKYKPWVENAQIGKKRLIASIQ